MISPTRYCVLMAQYEAECERARLARDTQRMSVALGKVDMLRRQMFGEMTKTP